MGFAMVAMRVSPGFTPGRGESACTQNNTVFIPDIHAFQPNASYNQNHITLLCSTKILLIRGVRPVRGRCGCSPVLGIGYKPAYGKNNLLGTCGNFIDTQISICDLVCTKTMKNQD